jgi:hypothetical protein
MEELQQLQDLAPKKLVLQLVVKVMQIKTWNLRPQILLDR